MIGTYDFCILLSNLYASWYKVAPSRLSGSPSIGSTIIWLTTSYLALEGVNKNSDGLTTCTSLLYNALNSISNDWSVPLLR